MPVTGVILAGGRGSRLGGVDKGLEVFHGRPLIEWVIERIAPQVDELLINANRNLDRYAGYGHRVIADQCTDFAGPLAGLQAALHHAAHDWVLCVPCDTPDLPHDLADRLRDALREHRHDIAVAATAQDLQPTITLTRRNLRAELDAFLASGQRRARDWISQHAFVAVHFDRAEGFANINTPDTLLARPPSP